MQVLELQLSAVFLSLDRPPPNFISSGRSWIENDRKIIAYVHLSRQGNTTA